MVEKDEDEVMIQKRAALAAGLLLGDITIYRLLESLAEGAVIVNEDQRIVIVNTRTAEIFDYTPATLIGAKFNMLLPERYREQHRHHLVDFFAKPKIRPMGHNKVFPGLTREGREIPIEVGLSFLRTDVGTVALALMTDVSARVEAESELRRKTADLETFVHTLAHDLVGGLSGLVGATELLSLQERGNTERAELVDEMKANSKRMAQVVKDLLAFATCSRSGLELSVLDMAPLCERAWHRLAERAQESGASLTRQQTFPAVRGHAAGVEEVWFNLLSNAIEHSGARPVIEVCSEPAPAGQVRFLVKDDGSGVPVGDLDELLSRPPAGHGLGLQISKHMVEKMGGELFVENLAEGGACFGFVLPAVD